MTLSNIISRRFALMVLLPTGCVLGYTAFIQTPLYESKSIIRVENRAEQNTGGGLMGPASSISANSALFQDAVKSRSVFNAINTRHPVKDSFGDGDILTGFGGTFGLFRHDNEAAYDYYNSHVKTTIDQNSGDAILTVDAPNAEDAYAIAKDAIAISTATINTTTDASNRRTQNALMSTIAQSRKGIDDDNKAIALLSASAHSVDPKTTLLAEQQTLTALIVKKADLIAENAATARATPNNPVLIDNRAEIAAYNNLIAAEKAASENNFGNMAALNAMMDQKTVDEQRLSDLLSAQNKQILTAAENHYDVTTISEPYRPHDARYPRVFLITTIALVAFALLWLFSG